MQSHYRWAGANTKGVVLCPEKPPCAAFPTRMGSSGGPSHSERIFHFEGKGFDSTLGYPGEGPVRGVMESLSEKKGVSLRFIVTLGYTPEFPLSPNEASE